MYFIGIDNSSNYSRLVAIDESEKIIGHHIGKSSNLNIHPRENVRDNLKKMILELNRLTNTKYGECGGICIGATCVDTREYAIEMEQLIWELGLGCPVKAVYDIDLILATETLDEPGIVLVSGKDCSAYAYDRDKIRHRIGGYGYLIDNAGSGYWIGMQAIRYSIMAHDGRFAPTALTERILKHYKKEDFDELINFVYSDKFNPNLIAELSPIVRQAVTENDAAAIEIENKAATELYFLIRALIERHKLQSSKIVLSGSVILTNDSLREKIAKLVKAHYKNASVIKHSKKPELGAAYIAKSLI